LSKIDFVQEAQIFHDKEREKVVDNSTELASKSWSTLEKKDEKY
jgi:hypothetical protein